MAATAFFLVDFVDLVAGLNGANDSLGRLDADLRLGLGLLVACRAQIALGLGQRFLGRLEVELVQRTGLFGQQLHARVFVDGDGAGAHEELLDVALALGDGHHARLEHGQSGHVVGEYAERAAQRGHVHLLDILGLVVEDLARRRERERHLGGHRASQVSQMLLAVSNLQQWAKHKRHVC